MGGRKGKTIAKPTIVINEPDSYFGEAVSYTYEYLVNSVSLATTPAVRDLLFVHTMRGRAINGHWSKEFLSGQKQINRYPNTITEEIIEDLGMSVIQIQRECQDIIDDIFAYTYGILSHLQHPDKKPKNLLKLMNESHEPLAGNERFRHYLVHNPVDVLRGIYIAAMVDNEQWRMKTAEKYGINIHRGKCVPVHLETAKAHGITLEDMTKMGSNPEMNLRELIRKGIISDRAQESSLDGYVSGFVELQKGQGISDDAVYLTLLLLFNEDVANGFLLGDAVDTWDKCAPRIVNGGQDEELAEKVLAKYKKIRGERLCTSSDLLKIIYLSAINGENYPSCSQRRFMEIDHQTGLTAIESHLIWVDHVKNGGPMPLAQKIGYQQVPNLSFYEKYLVRYSETLVKD